MQLTKTREALADLAANDRLGIGSHFEQDPRAAAVGMVLGEIAFDPDVNDFDDIIPDSTEAEASGIDQVSYGLPAKPLQFNVVADLRDMECVDWIEIPKRNSIIQIAKALKANPGDMFDHVNVYALDDREGVTSYAEAITTDEKLLSVCQSGLTFVISDFRRLAETMNGHSFGNVVGIKVNHLLEMKASLGELSLGGAKELNTKDARSLAAYDALLDDYHAGLDARLTDTGMVLARVVTSAELGSVLDESQADMEIAQAVKSLR